MSPDVFSLIADKVPSYIFVVLIFSYFIWSKFLKKGELKIENLKDIINILIIFVATGAFIIIIFMALLYLMIIFSSNDLGTSLASIFSNMVLVFSLILIWAFITYPWKTKELGLKKGREKLFQIMKHVTLISLCLIAFMILNLIFVWINHLFIVFGYSMISILIIIVFIFIVMCVSTRDTLFEKELANKSLWKHWFDLNFLKALIVFLIIFTIILLLLFPKVSYNSAVDKEYYIVNPEKFEREIYLLQDINVDVNFGLLWSATHSIPIDYGQYDFQKIETLKFELYLKLLNRTNEENLLSSLSTMRNHNQKISYFTDYELNEEKEFILLRYDYSDIIHSNIDYLIIRGLKSIEVSEKEYSYLDNLNCQNNICEGKINIKNNLNLLVRQDEYFIENLHNYNIENIENCQFTNISSNTVLSKNISSKDELQKHGHILNNGISADVSFMYVDSPKLNPFELKLKLTEDNFLRLEYLNIGEPLNTNISFIINCN